MAGTVESNVSAAITLEYLHATLHQDFGRSDDIVALGITAKSDDRGMFKQKKNVGDAIFFAKLDQALLQAQPASVINGPELDDGDQRGLPRISRIIRDHERSCHSCDPRKFVARFMR